MCISVTDGKVTPESGTSIKLIWELAADEKRRSNWEYGIYYGVSFADIIAKGKTNETVRDDTKFTVTKLNSCENYAFAVAIVGPKGIGPPSELFFKRTKYSPGAPPKNVDIKISDKLEMIIKWEASCPVVNEDIGYIIQILNKVNFR